MINPLPPITFAHFLPYQPCHHTLHPLFADNRILCRFQLLVVIVVYAVEGWWDGGFRGFERFGFWGRHDRERRARLAGCWLVGDVHSSMASRSEVDDEVQARGARAFLPSQAWYSEFRLHFAASTSSSMRIVYSSSSFSQSPSPAFPSLQPSYPRSRVHAPASRS